MTPIRSAELLRAKTVEKTGPKDSTERRRPINRPSEGEDRKNRFKKALDLDVADATCDEECENEIEVSMPCTRSLFDLAGQTPMRQAEQASDAPQTKSPYATLAQATANQAKMASAKMEISSHGSDQIPVESTAFEPAFEEVELMDDDLTQDSGSQDSDNSRHAISPYAVKELSRVDAHAGPIEQPEKANEVKKVHMQLVRELIDSMKTLTTSDRTETTVTLQHPPMFNGVSLVVTEFQSAQKEFNLTFLNLTNPEARALIELRHNQEALRSQLLEKGYHLHMVTIEPKIDIKVAHTVASESFAKQQERRQEKDGDLQDRDRKQR